MKADCELKSRNTRLALIREMGSSCPAQPRHTTLAQITGMGDCTFSCSITSRDKVGGAGRLFVWSWRHFLGIPPWREVASRGVADVVLLRPGKRI